ncbi:integral membrane protein [Penicillium taxi]|uniref:uncharacterized protein n=1 Tax=Penicillium taxi TaxID=168475 RepID=UPI0025457C0C|nr:uncharacterized protein N7495_004616 [Penicillium taxi]KAJ5899872.1 integral membrane protein [Penicillium taxi]
MHVSDRFLKQIGWSNSFVYTCTVATIKLSILALYKRLFATKRMLLAVNVMASFVVMWAVAISVAGVLNCLPVAKFWDRSIPGACMDPAKYYYGQQIPNIISDAILLLMPLKVVWDLPIVKSQKCLLAGVFLLGGL